MREVVVTYDSNGRLVKEKCMLVPYDADLYSVDGEKMPEEVSEQIKKDGFVLFEDKDGIFCLRTDQIKNIEFVNPL